MRGLVTSSARMLSRPRLGKIAPIEGGGGAETLFGLVEEGRLAPELEVSTATDLLWTLASVRVWEDLVMNRRWSSDRYRAQIRRTIRGALLGNL
jgi:hypothetical protein